MAERAFMVITKGSRKGERIPLTAVVDMGGKEVPVYIENMPPENERPAGWRPIWICPGCLANSLTQGSGVGANNSVFYSCVFENGGCGLRWRKSDDMLSGVALEIA